jgi:DNA anti-recombination protein RmuC
MTEGVSPFPADQRYVTAAEVDRHVSRLSTEIKEGVDKLSEQLHQSDYKWREELQHVISRTDDHSHEIRGLREREREQKDRERAQVDRQRWITGVILTLSGMAGALIYSVIELVRSWWPHKP